MTEEFWVQRRTPQHGHERILSGWTRDWLQALPEAVRPVALSSGYPHVANRLALSWRDAAVTGHVLEDLLVGKRRGRKGFSPAVLVELSRLREFHARGRVAPAPGTASPDRTEPQREGTRTESVWVRLRQPLRAMDLVLSSTAQDWLETLPRPLRPAQLCVAYPRILNRLALCWNDPVLTEQLLENLLVGRRGKRKGFPPAVADELLRLRRFHDHYRGVEVQESVWELQSLAPSDR